MPRLKRAPTEWTREYGRASHHPTFTLDKVVEIRGQNELYMLWRGSEDGVHPEDFEVDNGPQFLHGLSQAVRCSS